MNKGLFFLVTIILCCLLTANFLCSSVALPLIRVFNDKKLRYASSNQEWRIWKEDEAYRLDLPFNVAFLKYDEGDRVWLYSDLVFNFRKYHYHSPKEEWILNVYFYDSLEDKWINVIRCKVPKDVNEQVEDQNQYGIDVYLNRNNQYKVINLNCMEKVTDLHYPYSSLVNRLISELFKG